MVGSVYGWYVVGIPSGNQPHGGLENLRTVWKFLVGKITHKWSIFQPAIFDYRRVGLSIYLSIFLSIDRYTYIYV